MQSLIALVQMRSSCPLSLGLLWLVSCMQVAMVQPPLGDGGSGGDAVNGSGTDLGSGESCLTG